MVLSTLSEGNVDSIDGNIGISVYTLRMGGNWISSHGAIY